MKVISLHLFEKIVYSCKSSWRWLSGTFLRKLYIPVKVYEGDLLAPILKDKIEFEKIPDTVQFIFYHDIHWMVWFMLNNKKWLTTLETGNVWVFSCSPGLGGKHTPLKLWLCFMVNKRVLIAVEKRRETC